jgi:DNA modification methylase
MVARNRLISLAAGMLIMWRSEIKMYVGDARSLDLIGACESIDLIATHPPHASIIPYSHEREGDLSSVHNIAEFAEEMGKVAQECMRVLKPKALRHSNRRYKAEQAFRADNASRTHELP